jgi:hypothetical protein
MIFLIEPSLLLTSKSFLIATSFTVHNELEIPPFPHVESGEMSESESPISTHVSLFLSRLDQIYSRGIGAVMCPDERSRCFFGLNLGSWIVELCGRGDRHYGFADHIYYAA